MRFAVALVAGLFAAAPVWAQAVNPFAAFTADADSEIHIAADATVADFEAQTATYMGNVVVTQGQIKLRADEIKIIAPKGRISRIIATGKVILASPSGSAESKEAVYDVVPRIVTMKGGVLLSHGGNVMRGSALEVKLASGEAKLIGQVGADGKPGRVQGLFSPATVGAAPKEETSVPATPPTPAPKPQ